MLNGDAMTFVVGVGRSGTTLVQSMLNAHPHICFPPETHFLRLYVASRKWRRYSLRNDRNKIEQALVDDKYISRLELNIPELLGSIADNKEVEFGKLYSTMLQAYAKKKGKRHIGDKDPRSIEYIPYIHKHFPHAQIVNVIRDPRDVVVSRMKANWCQNRSFYNHVFAYRVQLRISMREGPLLLKNRYHLIFYEKLLKNPTRVLKEMCDNLHVEYSPEMLCFASSARELITDGEVQWKKESLGPLLSSNMEKWKDSLSGWRIAVVERLCREPFKYFGYQKSGAQSLLPWWQKLLLPVLESSYIVLEWIYRCWRRFNILFI